MVYHFDSPYSVGILNINALINLCAVLSVGTRRRGHDVLTCENSGQKCDGNVTTVYHQFQEILVANGRVLLVAWKSFFGSLTRELI